MTAHLLIDEKTARRLALLIEENLEGIAVSAFETGDRWTVEVILPDPQDHDAIQSLLQRELPEGPHLTFEPLAERDWVQASLTGLKPVQAGRFLIHGSHDRALAPANAIGIEIEAALAFGTGHHGTTRGCLMALDRLLKQRRPKRVLDVGTGSGILAIAAARASRVKITATDIDPTAIRAAKGNAELNRAAPFVKVWPAKHRLFAGYDLIFANILAPPLIRMAPRLVRLLARRGTIILSGLMPDHAPGVVSAYRGQGVALDKRLHLDGWVTLTMRKER